MKKRIHMKKGLCMTLLLCMLLPVMLAAPTALQASAEPAELKNVSLGCSYTSTAPYTQDADKYENNYRDKLFNELTDGKKGQSDMGSEWYAFTQAESEVVIDLGKKVSDLSHFTAEFSYQKTSSVYLPTEVLVYGSDQADGGFVELGRLSDITEDESKSGYPQYPGVHAFELDLAQTASYRYIKMTIKKSSGFCVFLSEVEVFSGYVSEFAFTDKRVVIQNDQVRGISEKKGVQTLRDMVNSVMGVSLLDAKGDPKTSGFFATGDRIVKKGADGQEKAYTVIIDGDVNGDGAVTALDCFKIRRHILVNNNLLKDCYLAAADCNGNGGCDAPDYLQIRRHFFALTNLYQKYEANLYNHVKMSYEIPDRYSDAYQDPFDVQTFEKMDVELKNGVYHITYHAPDGATWSVTFVKKRWGVWMLGAMEYTTANGAKKRLMDASTDYEWVMQCGAETSPTFRGGNHADYGLKEWDANNTANSNDRLLDITFYDAKSGKKLEIASGQKVTADGLRVVLHTNIYEKEYEKRNVLINVEKLYLFNGTDIHLASKLDIVKDTKFIRSYSAMLPVLKQYGNYVRLYNGDNVVKTIQTPLVGTSNYGNNFSNGNVATRAEFWGENEPACHLNVEIFNPEDQCLDSADETKVWDMNPHSNKVYFSMFGDSQKMVKQGTQWNFHTKWSFAYLPDFVNPEQPDEKLGF